MTRVVLVVVLLVALALPVAGQEAEQPAAWLAKPDFWIAASANVAGIGLFLCRVHAPGAAPYFGYATEAIGIPAVVFGTLDLVNGNASWTTVGLLSYAAWALAAGFVDHVLQVNYRDPVKPAILIPYVVTYYVGIGLLSATQRENGIAPWAIAGTTCVAVVAASFYARAMGAD